jgi:transmembrane sensor
MTPAITQVLFTAYVRGTASAADAVAVRAWLAQPANQLLAQYWMHQHWDQLAAQPFLPAAAEEPDYDMLLARLRPQLAPTAPRHWATPQWPRWVAAASFAGLLAGGGWLWYSQRPLEPLTMATAFGQLRTITLSDSSQVTLNGHSKLRYAASWAPGKPREVWLDGEGYFSIKHKANNQRFLVHTSAGLQVEVLGTKFVVARRREQTRVVLLSGKVRVEFDDHQQPDVIMRPGELVEAQDAHSTQPTLVVHQKVRTAPYAAWKDAKLVLDETSIAELATRLQDTYGLQVVVSTPELNRRRVTGTVPVRELGTLLQALEETFHLQAIRQGNQLTLAEKN